MTANILFLDDMEWRHKEFGRIVDKRGEGVRVWKAYTAAEAIELLGRVCFTQVFLDHDLCEGDTMVGVDEPSEQPTGMAVVDHILTMTYPPQDIIVHSLNGPARIQMACKLEDSGRIQRTRAIPFTELIWLLQS